MDGASLLDESKRVEKVGDLVRVLARKPNRFMTLDRGWIIRLAVEDRPTLLVRSDVEADEAHDIRHRKISKLHTLMPPHVWRGTREKPEGRAVALGTRIVVDLPAW
jgi:hypothetical protein